MRSKPFRCRVGLHAWMQAHPPDERLQRPDHQVCVRCGRKRNADVGSVPPGALGGGLGSGGMQ